MNFQDIKIPFLLGGADDDKSSPKDDALKQVDPKTEAAILEAVEQSNSSGSITNYIQGHSFLLFIILACLVCIFLVMQSTGFDITKLIENNPQAALVFGSVAIIATCAVLLITGYGSNKSIDDNHSDQ
jgi:hypothetical protein